MAKLIFSKKPIAELVSKNTHKKLRFGARCGAVATSCIFSAGAWAQADKVASVEEVLVTGTRATIQSSINVKRTSDVIVEALSANDIGDIPALSIGEAIETLTSAASHREQGGATEISIRGMGPYLGSTVMNGREASNGSGDRSVNFSQFPSELFGKIEIYKSQQASLIEGGVSGQISLDTVKPLDLGRQRIQMDLKGNYNPQHSGIKGEENDFGYRGTASYVDQFDMGDAGKLGVSVGVQTNQVTNPEQEYRTSSGFNDCRNDPNVSNGVYGSGRCTDGDGSLDNRVDPATGLAVDDANTPLIFTPNSRSYRQNTTDDDRQSFFGALQWQPNDRVDIGLDVQLSDRSFTEGINDLVFTDTRRINADSLVATDSGSVLAFNNAANIDVNSQFTERTEEYKGGGLSLEFQATDRLLLSTDISYSNTARRETILQTRLQSEPKDIYGVALPGGTDDPFTQYYLPGSGSQSGADVMLIELNNFDVTNHDVFADNARTRIDLNQARDNTITAVRGDFKYDTDWKAITSIEGGIRFSKLEFESFPRVREELTFDDKAIQPASIACRTEFPESGFLSDLTGGKPLITNLADDGSVIASGTGNGYATFDPICLAQELVAADNAIKIAKDSSFVARSVDTFPSPQQSVQNVYVEEKTTAAYLQANYASEFNSLPIRGNVGLRIVQTDVASKGLRPSYTTQLNEDDSVSLIEGGTFDEVVGGGSYTELLPSASITVDLHEDLLLRGGIFRGLSRPDPADLGFGRSIGIDDDDTATSIQELISGEVVANGNPNLLPLLSWNYDIALEWYPNKDTILAAGYYYKNFQGGFKNTQSIEQFNIDGTDFNEAVTLSSTDSDTSSLQGIELSLAHSFSYLPGAWSGLGTKLSYNHADSDFEFQDANFGASTLSDPSGNIISQTVALVPPANLFGFSEDVMSAQLYYQIGELDIQMIYKYRSEYFQQYISTPGNIRYVGEADVYEARITYNITDNVQIRFEGINLFNEPKTQYNPTPDNVSEVNNYGPRYYAGVRVKF